MADPTAIEDIIVNDRFWLKYARSSIENASKAWAETASRLLTGVGWFWTVYTSVAVFGVALVDRDLTNAQLFVIFLPVPVLGTTYLLALKATSAIAIEYDPRSPTEIAAEYVRSAEIRKSRIRDAVIGLIASAACVIVAGAVVGASPSRTPSESSLAVAGGSGTALLVEVQAHKEASITITMTDGDGETVAEEVVTASDRGRAATTLVPPTEPVPPIAIRAAWVVDDTMFTTETIFEIDETD